MKIARTPKNESFRIQAASEYAHASSSSQESFDELAYLASSLCDSEIAVITIVEENKVWFKSKLGLSASDVSREIAFCSHTILEKEMLIVEDTLLDERFFDNPLVVGPPFIRFYAGFIIKSSTGQHIGTFCIMDSKPKSLEAGQILSLKILCRQVKAQFELMMQSREIQKERDISQKALKIIDSTPDFIGTCLLDGTITYFNQAFAKDYIQEGKTNIIQYYPKHIRERLRNEALPECLKTGIWKGESAVIDRDGHEIPVLQTIICHKDRAGNPLYYSTIMQDLSVVKENKSRFETLMEVAPIGIYLTDPEGRVNYMNRNWIEQTGLEYGSMVNGHEAVHPEDREEYAHLWDEAIQEGKDFKKEFRIKNIKSGDVHDVSSSAYQLKNAKGEVIGYMGLNLDISDKKLAQNVLERTVIQLGSFISNIPTAVAMLDKNLCYLSISKRWITDYGLDQLGFNEKNIIGKPHYEIFPNVKDEWKALHVRALAGEHLYKNDDTYFRRDGQIDWLNWDLRPWVDQQGNIGGILMLTEVTTERKKNELEMIKAKSDAINAAKAKSAFLSNMSHEIRTPLNSIIGFADLLLQTPLNEEQARHVSTLNKSGSILLSLINDILDLSKIESKEVKLEAIPMSLEETCEHLCDIFSFKARKKEIRLNYYIQEGLDHFLGDPTRLSQIFLNLLGNAFKFTPKGFINISIERNKTCHPGNILVSVQDSGIGISKDKFEVIFENFGQDETSTTREYGGSGLGLAITKHLVQIMGGEIWVESEIGSGSNFCFTIELEPEKNQEANSPLHFLPKCTALIIDASHASASMLQRNLEQWKIDSHAVKNFREARIFLDQGSKDLVITSGMYTDGNALDLAKEYPHIKMIVLDSGLNPDIKNDFKNAGIVMIESPHVKKTLKQSLQKTLGTYLSQSFRPVHSTLEEIQEELMGSDLRILVVDDAVENRKLMNAYLKNYPFSVDYAENGADALKLIQSNHYHLVFMDMQMPIMDGFTATTKVREWEVAGERAQNKIVALTAYALPEEVEKCINAGCNSHLTKPIKKATILETIFAAKKSFDLTGR